MTALCEGHDLGRRSALDGESVMSVSGSLYALCSNVRVVTKSSSVYVCEKRIKQLSFLYICVRHAFQVADSDPRLHLRLRIVEEHLNGVPFRFHYDPLLDPLYPTDCLFFVYASVLLFTVHRSVTFSSIHGAWLLLFGSVTVLVAAILPCCHYE